MKGVITGFGNIALNGHLPGFRAHDDVRITGVFDPVDARAKECEAALPGARFYSDLDRMLQCEQPDFVDIATPPSSHGEYVARALEHGAHVLCEKPLVLDSGELERIASMVRSSGRIVFTVHNWRYSPLFRKADALLASGITGRTERIRYEVIRVKPSVAVGDDAGTNWRLDPAVAGGGILVDHGWHAFYMVNQWMGEAPLSVECVFEKRKFAAMSVEDTASATFFYGDGRKAELFFTWAGDKRSNNVFITGERGAINILDDRIVCETSGGTDEFFFDEGLSHGSHHPEWYGSIVRDFMAEIRGETPANRNFMEASCCFRMLDACRKSAVRNMPERVECRSEM
jgi:predicted dehydrogenase